MTDSHWGGIINPAREAAEKSYAAKRLGWVIIDPDRGFGAGMGIDESNPEIFTDRAEAEQIRQEIIEDMEYDAKEDEEDPVPEDKKPFLAVVMKEE